MDFYFWLIVFTLFILGAFAGIPFRGAPGLLGGVVAGLFGPMWYAGFYGVAYDDFAVRMHLVYLLVFGVASFFAIRKKSQEKIAAQDLDSMSEIFLLNMNVGGVAVAVISFFYFIANALV